ncbi:unnamed protein product [Ophioblennius macclurei]
MHVA